MNKEYERNEQIVEDWFSSFDTLKEVGERYGITRERVRQIILDNSVDGVVHKAIYVETDDEVRARRFEERKRKFWSNFLVTPEGCWEWVGYIDPLGYGRVRFLGWGGGCVHRIAYQIQYGSPQGLFVLHKCDNPACGNPEHLYLGTQAQNMADREERFKGIRSDQRNKALTPRRKVVV